MKIKRTRILLVLVGLAVCALPLSAKLRRPALATVRVANGTRTVADRLEEFGDAARARLAPDFRRVGARFPPKQIVLVGLKQEKRLEVWVSKDKNDFVLLKTFPILGASGSLGPKLKEGDGQVPEGLYRIESLNPNSLYHVALRVNYPNQFDRDRGKADGRKKLGGDIMIHGKRCSIGCLAMGDEAAEDLFTLAAKTGIANVSVILGPVDFRVRWLPAKMPEVPEWTAELYEGIKRELDRLKKEQTVQRKDP